MDKSEFVVAVTEELTDNDLVEVTEETLLADLSGWDSMGVLGIIAMIDDEFDQVVEVDALAECKTVGDIYNLVKQET